MKKKLLTSFVVVLVLMLALFAFTACDNATTKEGEELVTNGNFSIFENSKFDGWKTSWKSTDTGMSFQMTTEGALGITNTSASYSYLQQTIAVDTNEIYKVTVDIKIKEGLTGVNAAHVAFIENESYSFAGCTTTEGKWKTFTFYVKPKNTDFLTIALCVGSPEEKATGTVYYDNVSVSRIDKANVPEGANVVSFRKVKSVVNSETVNGIIFVVFLSVGTVAVLIAAYILIRRLFSKDDAFIDFGAKETKKGMVQSGKFFEKPAIICLGLMLLTFLVRLIMLLTLNGLGGTSSSIAEVAKYCGLKDGVKNFAAQNSRYIICAPGQLYIYAVVGAIGQNLELSAVSILIRFVNVLADMAIVALIYAYGKKYVGNKLSTIFAGLWAVLPFAFMTSGLQTTFECVTVALMLGALIALIDKKYLSSYLLITLAIVLDVRAFALAPIMLACMIYRYIKDDENKKKFTANRAKIVFGLIGSFVLAYVLTIPVAITQIQAGDAFFNFKLMAQQIMNVNYFVDNGLNLYGMVAMNGKAMIKSVAILNLIFVLVLELYVVSLYFKNRNKQEVILLASFVLLTLAVLSLKVNYTYLALGIALAFVYAMISGDKRMYFIAGSYSFLGATSLAQLMNSSGMVVPNATNSITSFETTDVFYIFFCVLAVLLTAYYIYVSYSITNDSKIVDIKPMNEPLKDVIKKRTINFVSRFKK